MSDFWTRTQFDTEKEERGRSTLWPLVVLVATLWVSATAATAGTVTNLANSGPGTLRDALAAATNGDTIDATGVSGVIHLIGPLSVNKSVTIKGPGPTELNVDGNLIDRVFNVGSGAIVKISGLTISRGLSSSSPPPNAGGGIHNDHGFLTLSNCVLMANSASGDTGGAIWNDGEFGGASLTIINCTFSNNQAGGSAGAIYNDGANGGSAILTIVSSTLSGNSAGFFGGAIFNTAAYYGKATVAITNSTISGNSAGRTAGGIYNNGDFVGSAAVTIISSTLSGNTSSTPSGAVCSEGSSGTATQTIGSSILNAGASGGTLATTTTSLGYNLSSDYANGLLSQPTDQVNTDPMLGPLQDNGGPTFTHALLPGSPAIDQGTNFSGAATDQRGVGFARIVDNPAVTNAGDGTDIGAFEVPKPTAIVTLSNLSQIYNGTARTVTASTSPPGLPVNITYNGSAVAPTNTGSYSVIGTINDPNYHGSVTNTLVIFVQLTAPVWEPSGQFQFSFLTSPGVNYTIETSTDLKNWTSALTFTSPGGPLTIIDPNSSSNPRRFYRVKIGP